MAGPFDKHRFEVWSASQHPLKHTLSDFAFINPAMPGVSNVDSALDWILAVLYPNTKPAVANQAALPLVGNTLNDYRVVTDDGDGNAASYRWEQREGEASPSWHKVMDMDWSTDSILAAYLDVSQDLFVIRKGKQDLDGSGNVITGLYGGQRIYGGTQANQNLTLEANSGDGVGAPTGYVQTGTHFRPTADASFDLATSALKFRDMWLSREAHVATMTIGSGSIVDSGGIIDFADNNLETTGDVACTTIFAAGAIIDTTLLLEGGSINDLSGVIQFNSIDLTAINSITVETGATIDTMTILSGSITDSTGTIDFDNENLITTGTLSAGDVTFLRLDVDNVRLDGNSISILDVDGDLDISANGVGTVNILSELITLGITATGTVSVTGQLNVDNLRFDGGIISSTNANGDIGLDPNGTGNIVTYARLLPSTDNSFDLGSATGPLRYRTLYLGTSIGDGTDAITMADLLSLRDINVGVAAGMSLFYDGSKWVASVPDTEVVHAALSGLTTGDAGHTQFVMLTGRSGGQTVQGGNAAAENLILESTSHASKGTVQTKDNFVPFANASFSGTWSGTDLGDSSHNFRDVYTKGEFFGLRIQNVTSGTLPASSAQNVGRMVYETDTRKLKVDTGSAFVPAGVSKYSNDTTWDGVQTTQTFTVSASISDARTALWQICNNANNFDRIYCTIQAISATQVTVTVGIPLPAGSYRLIGVE